MGVRLIKKSHGRLDTGLKISKMAMVDSDRNNEKYGCLQSLRI